MRLAKAAIPTWDPIEGGRASWVRFIDDATYDLGPDPDRRRFDEIVRRTLAGHYYPPDAVSVSGTFRSEGRPIRVGDRIIQTAPLLGKLGGIRLHSIAEIFVCEQGESSFRFGYVTTNHHFARGMWQIDLNHEVASLTLRVRSFATPGSIWYWLGMPLARLLQLRARRRAIEVFRAL